MQAKMNPEVKALWLSALRSGRFTQARSNLVASQPNGEVHYCCLGVLNELYIETHPGTDIHRRDWDYIEPGAGEFEAYNGTIKACPLCEEEGLLPSVCSWAGLLDKLPLLGEHTVAEHNDGFTTEGKERIAPKSFLEIADLIEELL